MLKRSLLTLLLLLLPVGAFAGKTVFVDGNPRTREPGTRVTAAYLNGVNTHRHDGKNLDGSGVLDYAADTGAANTLAIALAPALTTHVEGMPIYLKVGHTNTGAVTLAVNALSAVPVYKNLNQQLTAGDLQAGQIVGLSWDGSAYQLISYQSPKPTDLAPPGMVAPFYMPACPTGWLALDGQNVSRTTYSALYNAIGTIGGVGNGSTTFTLPDVRGYFIRGWDNGRNIDTGRVFGTVQADDFKAHVHETYAAVGGSETSSAQIPYSTVSQGDEAIVSNGMQPAGGAETRPKNIALMYCIKH